MLQGNSLDLSIKLEQNDQKSKEQELEQFVLLTNKIAESDRNNQILRQIKKGKINQVNKIRAAHRQVSDQNQSLQHQLDQLSDSIKEAKTSYRSKNDYFQELTKKYEQLALKQKQGQEKNTGMSKDNDKLEKKIVALQNQYDQIIRTNNEKSNYLRKLRKKREKQDQIIGDSQEKIQELEGLCENTKNKAVQLEQALSRQLEENQRLQKLVSEKEEQLQIIRRERQENSRKQEQNKRTKKQLKAKLQKMQSEIESKVAELQRLHSVHSRLEKEIEKVEKSQNLYEQMMQKRRQMVKKLRKDSTKLKKQKEAFKETNKS